jgi:hypothetical protein
VDYVDYNPENFSQDDNLEPDTKGDNPINFDY